MTDPPDSGTPVPVEGAGEAAEKEERLLLPRPPSWIPDSHGGKFRLVYVGLALLVAVAVAGFLAVILKPDPEVGPPWSAFQPNELGVAAAEEIAGFVAPRYRLSSGSQLVAVRAAPLAVQNIPVTAIAIERPPEIGGDPNIDVFTAEQSIQYVLCGLGENCAIEEGEPSRERARLLNREALELALYTFKYLEEVDSVVTVLPPRKGAVPPPEGEDPIWALFFERGDLGPQLVQPLSATLPIAEPPLADKIARSEIVTIDRLTEPRRFQYGFQQLQDGSVALVLQDPNIEG